MSTIANVLVLLIDKCRMCLENEGLFHILQTPNLATNIKKFTGLKILEDTMLPMKICQSCHSMISGWKEIKKLTIAVDNRLKILSSQQKQVLAIHREPNVCPAESTSCVDPIAVASGVIVELEELPQKKRKNAPNKNVLKKNENTQQFLENNMLDTRMDDTVNSTTMTVCQEPASAINLPLRETKAVNGPPFYCKICNKVSNSRTTMYFHERSHSGIKPHCCIICDKTFMTKGDLIKHIRVHTGEKPFKCEVCDKSFSQKASLKSHTSIHLRNFGTLHPVVQ